MKPTPQVTVDAAAEQVALDAVASGTGCRLEAHVDDLEAGRSGRAGVARGQRGRHEVAGVQADAGASASASVRSVGTIGVAGVVNVWSSPAMVASAPLAARR